MRAQNSPSTVVHGRTTVEDGSNGLTVSIFPRFLSPLSDAFTHLLEKMCKISDKISHRRNVNASGCFLKQSKTVVLNGKVDWILKTVHKL